MTVKSPAYKVARWSVVGMEGMYAKMFDPPTESPPPTDQLLLVPQGLIRPNPVPEVMWAAGLQSKPSAPHTVQRDLLHGLTQPTWDGKKKLLFFVIGDRDNPSANAGTYPGPTLRMPRSVIFNADVSGKGPPPHTIHWHGMEPTPMNDGVGHCSMELGHYVYQWQPNFMGFYFLHCHRNTMQHFEFGLYSAMLFEAPDAYFASCVIDPATGNPVLDASGKPTLNSIPIGHGRDGKRRVACNLDDPLSAPGTPRFIQFPGFNRNPVDTPDPGPGPTDTQISFVTDPHAMTVPFDVEALMVFDDRDSVWSDLASNAFATFPKSGSMPGLNDQFQNNPGTNGFFAFNDFNADYWFVTGVPVPAAKGGTGTIPANLVIPPSLNSGISGTQISVNAKTGDVILLRILDAAYNFLRVTIPVDVVVIAWDGRALGVAPYGHNESYLVPAGTPIKIAVGRRFDALCMSNVPVNDFIVAEFINHKSMDPEAGEVEEVLCTTKVPFSINGEVITAATVALSGTVLDQAGAPVAGATVTAAPKSLGGAVVPPVTTDANGKYVINGLNSGTYSVNAAVPNKEKLCLTTHVVNVSTQSVTAPNIVVSAADFAPNSYTLPEALKSLREVVGLDLPTPTEKLRFDVAPFLNGAPAPDSAIDIRDSLNILRMVVGLNPL